MVRYQPEHKDLTRQRIIQTAGRRLKRDGIEGSGVATLMKDAGLTNGAFYSHFDSKESLVAAAIADQLQQLNAGIESEAERGPRAIEQIVAWYLTPEHRDDPSGGCPNAALLDEISRCSVPTRQAYTDCLLDVIDALAARLPAQDPASGQLRAFSLLGLLAGTMQLARAVTDRALADRLLAQGIKDAGALFRAWAESDAQYDRTVVRD